MPAVRDINDAAAAARPHNAAIEVRRDDGVALGGQSGATAYRPGLRRTLGAAAFPGVDA